jgi:hypothetical protein
VGAATETETERLPETGTHPISLPNIPTLSFPFLSSALPFFD